MPQRYNDITLRIFNRAGFEELVVTDITKAELLYYLGEGPTVLVRRKGQRHWTLLGHVQLYNGVHLEVRQFGDELPLDAQVEFAIAIAKPKKNSILRSVIRLHVA